MPLNQIYYTQFHMAIWVMCTFIRMKWANIAATWLHSLGSRKISDFNAMSLVSWWVYLTAAVIIVAITAAAATYSWAKNIYIPFHTLLLFSSLIFCHLNNITNDDNSDDEDDQKERNEKRKKNKINK
jgi:hypothetical protein